MGGVSDAQPRRFNGRLDQRHPPGGCLVLFEGSLPIVIVLKQTEFVFYLGTLDFTRRERSHHGTTLGLSRMYHLVHRALRSRQDDHLLRFGETTDRGGLSIFLFGSPLFSWVSPRTVSTGTMSATGCVRTSPSPRRTGPRTSVAWPRWPSSSPTREWSAWPASSPRSSRTAKRPARSTSK